MTSSFQVLSERDYLDLIESIHQLQECETGSDLENVIRTYLFPLFQIDAFGSAALQPDPQNPELGKLSPIVTVGYSLQERDWALLCQPYMESFTRMYSKGMRTVLATDIDVSIDVFRQEFERFFDAHPEIDRSQAPTLENMTGHLAMVDGAETSLAIGLSRVARRDHPFTLRELRMAELLQPSLLHACRYVLLRRELHHFSALAEHLADKPAPIVLVQPKGHIMFCNAAFQNRFQVQQGQRLPEDLHQWLKRMDDTYSPTESFEEMDRFPPFYKHGKDVYRLSLTRLDPLEDYENRCWLFQFTPALRPQSRVGLAMKEAQLTARETEVASLVCDGFSDKDIAQRLFISPNTVNNHLKRIFKKMGVRTRVQLAHRLQGILQTEETP